MSHNHESIICPNCGYHATENYCARCGQPTHLHKETFIGLIVHFIGHYFHYDSKFWQTLKALWFSPGKLTIAYWNKQRMRYISPISLYIFISAVFFLVSSLRADKLVNVNTTDYASDSASTHKHIKVFKNNSNSFLDLNLNKHANEEEKAKVNELKEKVVHNIPKVFFFMIPLMALVLQLLFIKRKELFYVNHIIYALHFHSFWFSILFINEVYPFETGENVIAFIIALVSAVYFITALRNVYKISWGRSVLYSIITAITYMIFVVAVLMALVTFLFR